MQRFAVLLALLAASSASRAEASGMPVAMPAELLPGVRVTGAAALEDVHVEVTCNRTNLANDSSVCLVRATAHVRAIEPATLTLPPAPATTTIDGAPATGDRPIAPGTSVLVELVFERSLTIGERDADAPWILSANRTRHVFLGESRSVHRSGDGAHGVLFDGVQLSVHGATAVDASRAGAVAVSLEAVEIDGRGSVEAERPSLRLSIEPPPPPSEIVQHGGPYLGAGIWGPLDSDGNFAMRVGYEHAFFEHLILGLAFETDFDTVAESLLLEIASPELAILIPSISAGIGVVARQLGNRDADAALRLHAGYQFLAVGTYVDFDYWPAIGDWTMAAGARLSF